MGQSLSLTNDADHDVEQINSSVEQESARKIFDSIYQQTSNIELEYSEDLFGSDNIYSNLPLDAIKYIFEFLPFSDLFNTSRVSKKFNSLCWKHLKEIDISKESKSAALYVNDNVMARVLSLIPNIKRLSLYCCRLLTSESLELISFQINLQSLDLSYVPRLQISSLCKIAQKCTKLKRLVLGGSYRWNNGLYESFPFFPSLQIFVFKRPESMTKHFREFLQKQCKTLTGLNIDHPQNHSTFDSHIISDILTNKRCREQLTFLNLDFGEECFTDSQLSQLESLTRFKKLKGLSIATLGKEETCLKILKDIGNQLEYLSICRTGPSNEITKALLTLPFKKLKILSLHKQEYQTPSLQSENVSQILRCAMNRDGDLGQLECFEFCYVKDNLYEIDNLVSNFNPFFKNIKEWKLKLGFDDY